MKTIFFISIIFLMSCGSRQQGNTEAGARPETAHPEPKIKRTDFHFATKIDTTCGMPLSAGLEDTATVHGKLYGFCSKECKDEFVTAQTNKKK